MRKHHRHNNYRNQLITAKTHALSHDGRGIATIAGKTTFISGALANETVNFHYTRKRSQFDEGEVGAIITPAATRIEPHCPHAAICGGCCLQHLKHTAQLELKQQTLLQQLLHFGEIQPKKILEPLTGPIWQYRHKARLGVKYVDKKQKLLIGFREKNGRFLADLDSCAILHATVGQKLNQLRGLISALSIYRQIPQIEIAVGDNCTALILRHLAPFNSDDLKQLQNFAAQYNFYLYLQPQGIDSIHLIYPITKEQKLSYKLLDNKITLLFSPADFTQINYAINNKMLSQAIELLQPEKNEQILDLFCGIGNFTLPLATLCQHIIGVEGSVSAVKQAKENAIYNKINNADFHCHNLAEDCKQCSWAQQQYQAIILDPPRCGAEELIPLIVKLKAKKILYISCNPATLARDAGLLTKAGYKLTQAGIMDMFPHTKHVESMALFECSLKLS